MSKCATEFGAYIDLCAEDAINRVRKVIDCDRLISWWADLDSLDKSTSLAKRIIDVPLDGIKYDNLPELYTMYITRREHAFRAAGSTFCPGLAPATVPLPVTRAMVTMVVYGVQLSRYAYMAITQSAFNRGQPDLSRPAATWADCAEAIIARAMCPVEVPDEQA